MPDVLITEAQAQTAEAIKAGSDAATKLMSEGGFLGVLCVTLGLAVIALGWAVKVLHGQNQVLHAERAKELKGLTEAIVAFKNALDGVEDALQGNKSVLETRAQAIVDLGHHIERNAQDVRHGFANLSQALAGILEWVRRDRTGGAP